MVKSPLSYDEYTNEELLEMPFKKAIEGLTEKQQRFCEEYTRSYNIKMAVIKAGYDGEAKTIGYAIRKKPAAQRYIQWLKVRILKNTFIDAGAILDQHIRIAFSDITDFVEIHPQYIKLKPEDRMDGQLVKSIKSGRDGISIELYDKMKSLDFLSKYCEDMPRDFKEKLEERKVILQEQEFQFKKEMADITKNAMEDDGFMEAIREAAKKVWQD